MNITLICIGKLKEKYWQDACSEYIKRLGRFCTLSVREIKEERLPDRASVAEEQAVIRAEGEAILRAVRPESYLIALDVRGRVMSSEQLASHLEQLTLAGTSDLSLVIGGSLGLSESVLNQADLRLSFSAFTFPHQMMRVILLEQLYRAEKIIHHETYHK